MGVKFQRQNVCAVGRSTRKRPMDVGLRGGYESYGLLIHAHDIDCCLVWDLSPQKKGGYTTKT